MKSVSFTMCNVESSKVGVFRTHETMCQEKSWLLMPLRDRLPPSQLMVINAVDIDMSCFLPTSYQMPLRFANTCNDKEIFWLPPKMSPTVAITKFLFDWCEGLIHPSSFAKELLFSLRKDWTFSQTEGSSHSSSNPARKHIAGRRDTCSSSMSCPSICEAIQITSIASTEERAQMQVSASDHCEGTICFRVSKLAKDQINEECLFRKSLGCWCCCVTNHFGWCFRLWQEWAQHAALPGFHNRSMTLLQATEWRLLGSSRGGLQQRTTKGKQHLRHKQRMMIHPEWNQRSLSHGAILSDHVACRLYKYSRPN